MDDPSSPDTRGWALWKLPAKVVTVVLAVEAGAVALVVAGASVPTLPDVGLAAFLATLSVVHTELATGIERARRRAAETSYFDLSSVWTFAAALLLPPLLAAAVIGVVYLHLWQRVWRPAAGAAATATSTPRPRCCSPPAAAHAVVPGPAGCPADPADVIGVVGRRAGRAPVRRGQHRARRRRDRLHPRPARQPRPHRPLGRQRARGRHDLHGRARRRSAGLHTGPGRARAAAHPRAPPGRPGAPAGGGGEHRREDRAAQRGGVADRGGPDGPPRCIAPAGRRPCSSWTSTTSRWSTTPTATSRATSCSLRWPRSCGPGCASPTSWAGSAARSSSSCCRTWPTGPRARARCTRWPSASASGSPRSTWPSARPDGGLTITGLTVSVGAAAVPGDGTTLEQVMKAADVALYAAKRDGRNLVRVAAGGLPVPDIPAPRRAS